MPLLPRCDDMVMIQIHFCSLSHPGQHLHYIELAHEKKVTKFTYCKTKKEKPS